MAPEETTAGRNSIIKAASKDLLNSKTDVHNIGTKTRKNNAKINEITANIFEKFLTLKPGDPNLRANQPVADIVKNMRNVMIMTSSKSSVTIITKLTKVIIA
ncbi:MAG: hypothetical protein WBG71_11320 [Leeuwenhoekiella sp.]